jgi:hypothetical protein
LIHTIEPPKFRGKAARELYTELVR